MNKQLQSICSVISFNRGLYKNVFRDNKDVLNHYLFYSDYLDETTNSPCFFDVSLNKFIPIHLFHIKPKKALIDRLIKEMKVFLPKFKPIFPVVTPESLNREEFYKQIVAEESHKLRQILGGDYLFVRPRIREFNFNQNSPQAILHLALELCSAWKIYLDEEIEKEHFLPDEKVCNGTIKQRDLLEEVLKTLQ